MSMVSEMQHLNNLKLILRCNILFIVLFIFTILYILLFTVIIKYDSKYDGTETTITGKIREYSINGSKLQMTIASKEDIIATYYIKSEEEKENLLENIVIGQTINLSGTLELPLNNTIPNNFNYRKYLYNQKIYYLFNIDSYVIQDDANFIDKIKDYLYKRAYNLDNSSYLLVLVLGDKSLISSEIYNNYQTNGTSHLLAISGSHIAVLLTVFSFILRRFKEIPKLLILSGILLFFAFITNFQAAVMRAIIFFILNSINKIKKLNYSNLQILLITAFILILLNPFIIYDLGFIYSFTICGGIIYYSDKITGNYFVKMFKLSFISFLFSLPISACINYEVNITSILINMLFVPWISIIVFPLAIITFIIPLLNPLLSLTLTITDFFNSFFAKLSLFINIPKTNMIFIIILFLFIILLKNNKKHFIGIISILLIIKIIPKLDNNYYLYYLDIGQGDSTILVSPHQKEVIMIDTGGKITYETEDWQKSNKTYNLSDNTIKFLKSLGIEKIDKMIITHGDMDHAGEAINIINKVNVNTVILNNGELNDIELNIINTLKTKNIAYYQNIKETVFYSNKLYFLNDELYDNENDNSIVLYTNINGLKLLFMGDAGVTVEDKLLASFNIRNIDILKVGHHGSDTSTSQEFIDYINPKYSIISVGRNNRYNHPKEEVLDILKYTNIYRTDKNGSVIFKIKNNKYSITTYDP